MIGRAKLRKHQASEAMVPVAFLQLHELCAIYLYEVVFLHPPFCLALGIRGDHPQRQTASRHGDRAGDGW